MQISITSTPLVFSSIFQRLSTWSLHLNLHEFTSILFFSSFWSIWHKNQLHTFSRSWDIPGERFMRFWPEFAFAHAQTYHILYANLAEKLNYPCTLYTKISRLLLDRFKPNKDHSTQNSTLNIRRSLPKLSELRKILTRNLYLFVETTKPEAFS